MTEETRELAHAIRAEVERRGHTFSGAARCMGMAPAALLSYLNPSKRTTRNLKRKHWPAVAQYLGWTIAAVTATAKSDDVRLARQRETKSRPPPLVDLSGLSFPVMTLAGVVHRFPIRCSGPGGCERCDIRTECQEIAGTDDFVLCERVLELELWPEPGEIDVSVYDDAVVNVLEIAYHEMEAVDDRG